VLESMESRSGRREATPVRAYIGAHRPSWPVGSHTVGRTEHDSKGGRATGQHGRAASRRAQRVLQVGQCVWEGGRRTRQRGVVLVVSSSVGKRRLESSTKGLEQSMSEILAELAELSVNWSLSTLYSA